MKTWTVLLTDGLYFSIEAASYKYWAQTAVGPGTSFRDGEDSEVLFVEHGRLAAIIAGDSLIGGIEKAGSTPSPEKDAQVRRARGRISAL